MRFLISLAWRDLRGSGRALFIFCACLVLGVTLVAASGSLYRLVSNSLLTDTRQLLGGDLQVNSIQPLPTEAIDWLSRHGKISRLTELYTMLITGEDEFVRVELQSVDDAYPLYGRLELNPNRELNDIIDKQKGRWGVAIDRTLASRYRLAVGDPVFIGALEMEVRALIMKQPDRNLSANWRGPPVLISQQAILDANLIQPGSRVDHEYRVATELPVDHWKMLFYQRFPDRGWEVRSFEDRSQRISERLEQIASGLLIIGFSTLLIGGLGVFSSIQSYLQGKKQNIATLRSLGMRNRRIASVYLLQIGLLGGASSLLGCLIGASLALTGGTMIAAELPVSTTLSAFPAALISAFMFGLLTAFCFALPTLGTTLSVSPAGLFRDIDRSKSGVPGIWIIATALCAAGIITLALLITPSPVFGAGFIFMVSFLLLLLELVLRLIRYVALIIEESLGDRTGLTLRLALANLHRPSTPLRSTLLSLGLALTLLVTCTLVVYSLLRSIQETIPEQSPALVLYDISSHQVKDIENILKEISSQVRVELAPLVRSRISAINGQPVASLLDTQQHDLQDALNDDHKLSYRGGNVDAIELIEGEWWQTEQTTPAMSLEDREAKRLGVNLGDRITYDIGGKTVEMRINAIHRQRGVQTRFWFEGIVADGVLESTINRYVGAAWLNDDRALEAQKQISRVAPNVISVRTARILATAQGLLKKATSGLAVIAGISLLASLLVLFSVIAAGRERQVYDASLLNALGVRFSVIRSSLYLEFLLIALITALFAVTLGSAIALPLLEWRMKLPASDLIWSGVLVALVGSITALASGAQYLLRRLQVKTAILTRLL